MKILFSIIFVITVIALIVFYISDETLFNFIFSFVIIIETFINNYVLFSFIVYIVLGIFCINIPGLTTPFIIFGGFFFDYSGFLVSYISLIIGSLVIYNLAKQKVSYLINYTENGKINNYISHLNKNQFGYLFLLSLYIPHIIINIVSGYLNVSLKNFLCVVILSNIIYYSVVVKIGISLKSLNIGIYKNIREMLHNSASFNELYNLTVLISILIVAGLIIKLLKKHFDPDLG